MSPCFALADLVAGALTAQKSEIVEYKHGEVFFKGQVPYDDATKEKRPGVLIVRQWKGLNTQAKSEIAGFQKEMRRAGVNWPMISYGGAVHSFTKPEAGDDPSKSVTYEAKADRRCCEAMKLFFPEIFREGVQAR